MCCQAKIRVQLPERQETDGRETAEAGHVKDEKALKAGDWMDQGRKGWMDQECLKGWMDQGRNSGADGGISIWSGKPFVMIRP